MTVPARQTRRDPLLGSGRPLMLLTGFDAITAAALENRAVPGFVAYNLETAQGIVLAAERSRLPVLLMAGSSAFAHAGRRELATLCLDLAHHAEAPVGVHLDHCRSPDEVRACLELGYTSVMIDGSHLTYAENVELTRGVVREAHSYGAWVEAELVGTAGDEDASTGAVSSGMTDPGVAAGFVSATGIDALAVAVGNVHGYTPVEPAIDLDRLERIRDLTGIPLVLHGASGLAAQTVRQCLDRGVAKVNVNTELRNAYLTATSTALPLAMQKVDLVALLEAGREAVATAATEILQSLSATPPPRAPAD
jgi:tagatose 1,6-diphosphate aldolase GatY/KbaY